MDNALSKRRIDAWDSQLTEEQRWIVFERSSRFNHSDLAAWIAAEFGIKPPSRTAYYDWLEGMRKLEAPRRLQLALQAEREAAALAQTHKLDAGAANSLAAIGREAALNGSPATASRLINAAVSIAAIDLKAQELKLKREDQRIKAATLALSERKFEAMESRATAAEKRAEAAEAETAALKAKIAGLESALQEAGKSTAADPAAVAEALDKHLGVKK